MYAHPMVKIVNIHDAKTHFSKLLADIEQGEEVIIARSGTHVAKLVPYSSERPRFADRSPQLSQVNSDVLVDDPDDGIQWSSDVEPG